jgi:hypothetical protein
MFQPSRPLVKWSNVEKRLASKKGCSNEVDAAKRFSTLDHLTNGRLGWNIVTSYKKAAFKAIGVES